jgi:hypothetical protein
MGVTLMGGGERYVDVWLAASSLARLARCLPSARKPAVAYDYKYQINQTELCKDTYHTDMTINSLNPPVSLWDQEFRMHNLLNGKHNAILDAETNCGAMYHDM